MEAVRKEKARYESAAKLAELLIPNDTSWKLTNPREDRSKPRTHRYGPGTSLNEKGLGRDGLQSLSVGNEEKETPKDSPRKVRNHLLLKEKEEEKRKITQLPS